MPDSNKNYFSIGASYDTGNWALDVGYAYVRFNKSPIGSEIAYKETNGRGDFKTDVHLLSAQVTFRF